MKTTLLAGAYFALFTTEAWAYLDPGTGSILVQGLIAAMATGLFAFRSKLMQVRAFFSRSPKAPTSRPDAN